MRAIAVREIRPKVFIGSAVEGLHVAQALQAELAHYCQVTLWTQAAFLPSRITVNELTRNAEEHEFAILVFTPDDTLIKRTRQVAVPRDNVIFELGLFIGKLGLERVFFVYCEDDEIEVPTDLAGVTPIKYKSSERNKLRSALGPAALSIREAIDSVTQASITSFPRNPRAIDEAIEIIPKTQQEWSKADERFNAGFPYTWQYVETAVIAWLFRHYRDMIHGYAEPETVEQQPTLLVNNVKLNPDFLVRHADGTTTIAEVKSVLKAQSIADLEAEVLQIVARTNVLDLGPKDRVMIVLVQPGDSSVLGGIDDSNRVARLLPSHVDMVLGHMAHANFVSNIQFSGRAPDR